MDHIEEIRRLVVKSLFADDDFMDIFVLKGGNALSLAYKLHDRGSIDIDISMQSDFIDFDINREDILKKLEVAFGKVFDLSEYKAFDFKIIKKPRKKTDDLSFWGGYQLLFKVISTKKYNANDFDRTRKTALMLGKDNKKDFKVDISRYEYCLQKREIEFDDFYIYAYSPLMIVDEKLRAICQQLPEYKLIIGSMTQKPRARDFFDIFVVFENLIDEQQFYSNENRLILAEIFSAKKVPLNFLNLIKDSYDFHEIGYASLQDIVPVKTELKSFNFYFDFVINKINALDPSWII